MKADIFKKSYLFNDPDEVEEAVEEPAAEETVEEPAAEEPAVEEPAAEEAAEEPAEEEPAAEESAAEEAAEEPAAEEPAAEEAAEESAEEEPAAEESAAEEAAEESAAEEAAEEPGDQNPQTNPGWTQGDNGEYTHTETIENDDDTTTVQTTTAYPDGTTTVEETTYDSDNNVTGTKTTRYDGSRVVSTSETTPTEDGGSVTTTTTYDENGKPVVVTTRNNDGSIEITDGDDVLYRSREGASSSDISYDLEAMMDAYFEAVKLANYGPTIEKMNNMDILEGLTDTNGGSLNLDGLNGCNDCVGKACGAKGSTSNASSLASTMRAVIEAIVDAEGEAYRTEWDKRLEEHADLFGDDLDQADDYTGQTPDEEQETPPDEEQETPPAEETPPADDDPYDTKPPAATEAPTTATEAPTEEPLTLEKLEELLGVKFEDLAEGSSKVTYGEDFDGVNIQYSDEALEEANINYRLLSILNYFGRNADDQKLYDKDGKQITSITEDMDNITVRYKKNGKEYQLTLKIKDGNNIQVKYDGEVEK